MQGGAWGSGDTTGGDDGRGAGREHDGGILSVPCLYEQYVSWEPCGNWICISDGARVEPWAFGFHGDGAVRADRMRGDRVGVGDIGEVQSAAWGSGDAACGDDGRGAAKQRDCSILDGRWESERDEGIQQGRDRLGVDDGAWGWLWGCGVHGD